MIKKLALLAALLGLTQLYCLPVHADPTLPPNAGFRIERELNLTDLQKAQLKPLLKSVHQQARSIRRDTTLTPQQKIQKLLFLRSQTKAQINLILTPEQQQQLAYLRQQARLARQNLAVPQQPIQ